MFVRLAQGVWPIAPRPTVRWGRTCGIAGLLTLLLWPACPVRADSLYIADSQDSTIYVYDTTSRQTREFANAGSGLSDPTALAYDGADNRLYVANGNGTIYQYDANTGQGTQVGSLSSGTPSALAYDAVNDRLYIAADGGTTTVYQYDAGNGLITDVESSSAVPDPTALAYDYTHDRLYIANDQGATTVYQYDADSRQTTAVEDSSTVPDPTALAYNYTYDRLYIGNEGATTVYQYDAGSGQPTGIIDSGTVGNPTSFTYDAGNDSLYIGNAGGPVTVYQYDDLTQQVQGVEDSQSVPFASGAAVQAVPEPASVALLGIGGAGLLCRLGRRKKLRRQPENQ